MIDTVVETTSTVLSRCALADSEQRQAFLLKLSDALRAEPNAEAVADRALQILFEHMGLDRCYIVIYRPEADQAAFPHQLHDDSLSPLPAYVRLSDFPKGFKLVSERTLVIDNIAQMDELSDEDRANIEALGVRALLNATLRKGGNNPLWAIAVGSKHPRVWSRSEISLVEEVTERTWAAVERARADAALRKSGSEYRALFEAIDSGFCVIEMIFGEDGRAIDYRFVEVNPAFERQSGLVDAVGHCISEFAPDLEEHWFERYGRVALTGESMRVEGEAAPLGRWFDINAFHVGAPEQRRVAVLFSDITDRKRVEAALAAGQQQFETLINQAPLGVYLVDSDFVIRQVNPVAMPVFGDIEGGPVGRDFDEVIHVLWDKEYADEIVRIFRHTLETGKSFFTPERGERRSDLDIIEYYEWQLDRIMLPDGRYGVVCYFRDISAQVNARMQIETGREFALESERRQGLLLAELQHRVRNILAMIQSVVRRTLDTSESAEEYARHLGGRIAAMARTQALLTRSLERKVDLEAALRDELLSAAAGDERFQCEGPDVGLPPKAAEVLTLAIHELATNSVKYGALSGKEGQVAIRWMIETRDGKPWLVFEWKESRVGSAAGAKRKGFGTELITRRVPYELGGKGSLKVAADQMISTIEFPLEPSSSILESRTPEQVQ